MEQVNNLKDCFTVKEQSKVNAYYYVVSRRYVERTPS